ncbi:hypothetical protein [Leptothermofonsia sp. ETS-13]|uniref:hypothetical protein n=1 Tax=Leptothermofonsia sp. ETS-13 TaxID=3035696 RepID=UPI003B9F4271
MAKELLSGEIASFFNECDRSTLKVELLRRQLRITSPVPLQQIRAPFPGCSNEIGIVTKEIL